MEVTVRMMEQAHGVMPSTSSDPVPMSSNSVATSREVWFLTHSLSFPPSLLPHSLSLSLFLSLITLSVQAFPSVDAWLESLQLSQYANNLKDKGIIRLFQVPSITEEVSSELLCMLLSGFLISSSLHCAEF